MNKRKLEVVEAEIQEASYEAFFYVGQRLLEIKRDRLFEQEDFKSWDAYCRAGRLDYKKAQADVYIRASTLRKVDGFPSSANDWTVHQLQELAKCETDNDAKRVAKKVISHAKKTKERVTAKLIASIRDGETSKPAKQLEAASLDKHLDKLASTLVKWRISLEQIDLNQWEDVPQDVMTRVTTETNNLLKFLKG